MIKRIFCAFITIFSFILFCFPLFACDNGEETKNPKSSVFDETNIVLSFSAMSDVHQQMDRTGPYNKLVNALKFSEELNGKPLDLALFAGDLTERTWNASLSEEYSAKYNADIQMFKNAIEESLDLSKTDVFYALGNHDTDWTGTGDKERMEAVPALFREQLGPAFFMADADDSNVDAGLRHAVKNGYHFLAIQPDDYWKIDGYSDATLTWLDNQLKVITRNNPEQYVFVTAHPPVYNSTIFGSNRQDWADAGVASVLEKYPQAIYFSGHIHNVLQDENQLSQNGKFTAIDCGGVKYVSVKNVDGAGTVQYSNAPGHCEEDYSQGLLIQVDKNGNVKVTRCDYFRKAVIKDAWEFEYPKADKSHLAKYDDERRKANNLAPEFAENAVATAVKSNGMLTLSWDVASDDDMVRHYKINAYNVVDGEEVLSKTFYITTVNYRYLKAEDMPDKMSCSLISSLSGECKFEIIGVDSWNKEGKPLTFTATL